MVCPGVTGPLNEIPRPAFETDDVWRDSPRAAVDRLDMSQAQLARTIRKAASPQPATSTARKHAIATWIPNADHTTPKPTDATSRASPVALARSPEPLARIAGGMSPLASAMSTPSVMA